MVDFQTLSTTVLSSPSLLFILGGITGALCGTYIYKLHYRAKDLQRQTFLETTQNTLDEKNDHLATVSAKLETLQKDHADLDATLRHERTTMAEKVKLLNDAKEQMAHMFKSLSQDVMDANRESFLTLAQERLKQFQNTAQTDLEKRQKAIEDIVTPVNKTLETMDKKIVDLEKARAGAYGELKEHLTTMKTDQDKLRTETASLVQALRSPSARGQWGELQLKRTLEMAGMIEGVHFEQQAVTAEGTRPDVIINLPGGQTIVIDAKTPIEAYLDALKDGITEDERIAQLTRHARHVREHLKSLGSKKYWAQFDTPEFVVMFLPGESYFSAALERDPSLIEAGVDNRVIPATPTTLIAMLRAVAYGWRQEALAKNAQDIANLGRELYKRLSVFGRHMEDVGKGIDRAMGSYNKAIGSLEKNVMVTARKFDDLEASPEKAQLPPIKTIEDAPRKLSAPEFEDKDFEERKKQEK